MKGRDSHSSPRILICRLSHIGDCILTLPMVSALRQAIPNAHIIWAVESPSNKLLQRHPDIDELIVVPKQWLKSPKTIWQMRKRLREYQFDFAIDPQGLTKSAALARLSGAKQRIGFAGKKHGRELSRILNNRLVPVSTQHLVDRSVDLLSELGIQPDSVKFKLPIENTAIARIQKFIVDHSLNDSPTGTFVTINPGASWPSKKWENNKFAELAIEIAANHQLRSVISWAGEEELQDAEQIVDQSGGAAVLACPTSLQELAALLYQSSIYIGCDTGPTHLAAAVGTTCVALYGPTRPQDSGAYGPHHFAIQNWYQSGGNRERRRASNEAMRSISVDQVLHYCDIALSRSLPDVESSQAA